MKKYNFTCDKCDKKILADEDRVVDIVNDDFDCPSCLGRSFTPKEDYSFVLKCGCDFSTSASFSELETYLNGGCPDSSPDIEAPANRHFHHITIKESNYFLYSRYLWQVQRTSANKMLSIGRNDFWEYLIHFTSSKRINEIKESDSICAKQTGYFSRTKGYGGKSLSVCLTEAPATVSDDFFKKFGSVGFVFRKSDLIHLGAQPIIHLSEKLIKTQIASKGFDDALVPFVQLYRPPKQHGAAKPYDYVFEREWRVPDDINFEDVKPVGLLFERKPTTGFFPDKRNWIAKLEMALKYGEIIIDKR